MYDATRHFEMLRRKLSQRENQVKILLSNRTSAKVMLLDKQKRYASLPKNAIARVTNILWDLVILILWEVKCVECHGRAE